MATIKIRRLSRSYANYLKKHLAKEHPKTKGKIVLTRNCRRRCR